MRLVINLESAIHLYWSCFENEALAEEFDEMISYEDTCEEEDTVVWVEASDEMVPPPWHWECTPVAGENGDREDDVDDERKERDLKLKRG